MISIIHLRVKNNALFPSCTYTIYESREEFYWSWLSLREKASPGVQQQLFKPIEMEVNLQKGKQWKYIFPPEIFFKQGHGECKWRSFCDGKIVIDSETSTAHTHMHWHLLEWKLRVGEQMVGAKRGLLWLRTQRHAVDWRRIEETGRTLNCWPGNPADDTMA